MTSDPTKQTGRAPIYDGLWDREDFAKNVGCSFRTMHRWIAQGLPFAKISNRLWFRPEDVHAFIAGKFDQPEQPKKKAGRKRFMEGGR